MTRPPLSFIQISDTHLGASKDFLFKERNAYEHAEALLERLKSLPVLPDFIVHTGDVANNCEEESYLLAKELFSKISVPTYFVTGNHDLSSLMRKHLSFGPKQDFFPGQDELSYQFSVKGFKFIVLDGRGEDSIDPHGDLKSRSLDFLKKELLRSTEPICIFTHFPSLPLFAPWIDQNARFINWESLHETLAEHRSIIKGVFIGHIHQSTQVTCDGVTYTSVPSTVFNFGSWATDSSISMDPITPPGFNFVTLTEQQIVVKQIAV